MGIRAEAEKIIADEKRVRAEKQEQKVAAAREHLPAAMKQWSVGMGLADVPECTNVRGNYDSYDDTPKTRVTFDFVEDGLAFRGALLVFDAGESRFTVTIDHSQVSIRTLPDLVQALKDKEAYRNS